MGMFELRMNVYLKASAVTVVAILAQAGVVMAQQPVPADTNKVHKVILQQDTVNQKKLVKPVTSADTTQYQSIKAFLKSGKFTGSTLR